MFCEFKEAKNDQFRSHGRIFHERKGGKRVEMF